jgi:hypothetical protein
MYVCTYVYKFNNASNAFETVFDPVNNEKIIKGKQKYLEVRSPTNKSKRFLCG